MQGFTKLHESYDGGTWEMKRRPGQKIKLTSIDELLGVNNEESALDLEIVKIRSKG